MTKKYRSIKDANDNGKLFVFEGIDNVGKSTIVAEVEKHLQKRNIAYSIYSFPGKVSRTLGALVYDLHHNQKDYFDKSINALSLQMLHVAAHIDLIESKILPDLKQGKVVLLDRFWWSTYAYGVANGIKKSILQDIISIEKKILRKALIGQYFFITRKDKVNEYNSDFTEKVLRSYAELCEEAKSKELLTCINNDSDLSSAVQDVLKKLIGEQAVEVNHKLEFNFENSFFEKNKNKTMSYIIKPPRLMTTAVYNMYWKFAAERQNIFFKRFHKHKYPWTDDPILQKYKFTNAYRASDRVSQYLIKQVIYNDRQYSPEDIFFRIILFKLFNKIETWECLQSKLGDINYKDYRYELYDKALTDMLAQKYTIYSAAYIMPSGGSSFGCRRKHQNNLRLLEMMMNDRLPQKLATLQSMEQLYYLLLSYPTLGKFLAFQYCIDINYSELCDFSEMTFVVAGPGASSGIRKCFQNTYNYTDEYIIKYMAETQEQEFNRLGLDFQTLWGRPLQLIDCQNLFCETDKYARVAFPDKQGDLNRKRIKQLFNAHKEDIDFFYPPKWNINQFIKRR